MSEGEGEDAVSSVVTQLTAEPRLVRTTDGGGWTGLLRAAERGNDEMVAVLLTHGASLEEATPRGSTPLMVTVWENKLSTCKILLEKGANVHHARHSDGITPLMKAAENGNDEIVTLLR